MENTYYIIDTETGRLFMGDTEYCPWILNAFTDHVLHAYAFYREDEAKRWCARYEKTKTDYNGNTPLKKGRLAVAKLELKII